MSVFSWEDKDAHFSAWKEFACVHKMRTSMWKVFLFTLLWSSSSFFNLKRLGPVSVCFTLTVCLCHFALVVIFFFWILSIEQDTFMHTHTLHRRLNSCGQSLWDDCLSIYWLRDAWQAVNRSVEALLALTLYCSLDDHHRSLYLFLSRLSLCHCHAKNALPKGKLIAHIWVSACVLICLHNHTRSLSQAHLLAALVYLTILMCR